LQGSFYVCAEIVSIAATVIIFTVLNRFPISGPWIRQLKDAVKCSMV
jgi:hypothetical protein